jgi:hypothetical protein
LPQHANRDGEIDEDCNAENEGPLHAANIAYHAGAVEEAAPEGLAQPRGGIVTGAAFAGAENA